MDKKLNFTDLSNFYAKALGVSVAEAESFVHAFFEVVVEGLEKDGSVKINGLGTFKIVEVESRSSVNINTGERFEIDGHKRLTFVPADSLKEIINAPFAMFEPVEVDDDIDDDDDEKEVSMDDSSVEEVVAVEESVVAEETIAEETSVVEEEVAVAEETVAISVPKIEIEEEMPQVVVEEKKYILSTEEIEEEMPFEESDFVSENCVVDTMDEPVEAHEEVFEEEVSEVVVEEQMMPVEEPQSEVSEEKSEDENLAVSAEAMEKVVVEKVAPVAKEKVLYFDTLPRKKKNNKLLKFSALFASVLLCAAVVFVGWKFYEKKSLSDNNIIKEEIAVVEKIEIPVVEISKDSLLIQADSIVVAEDSLAGVQSDSVESKQLVAVQKDSIVEQQPQMKEEKQKIESVESFKIVDALAVRELSTIFVADTTDYKIAGTMCNHKVKSEETLIRISLNYYGDKRLWPYIVKYNKMLRPNDLACDMVLKIPRLVPAK